MARSRRLILLVQLPIPPAGLEPVRGNVPLAAGLVKLYALRQGLGDDYDIEILPPRLANTLGDQGLVASIAKRRPWMVGFTCYLWNVERTLWIAARVKERDPAVRILLGGPEMTADSPWLSGGTTAALAHPEDTRPPVAPCDYAVIGEGEQTFAELLARLRDGAGVLPPIAGLWTAEAPSPPGRGPLVDLDAVWSPYVAGILDAGDERFMLIETTRGCRYRCKYCYYPKSFQGIHYLSADEIAANLRWAGEHEVSEVFLLDPTLNQRPDFAGLLRLLARANPEQRFTYSAELRAEGVDADVARLMREANFHEAEIGLQSVDPHTQRLMGRPVDLAAFERGAKVLLAEGIRVRVDLILGLPGDTADSVRRGIEYLERTRPCSELQVFNLSILPGTAFRREAAGLGLEYQPRPPYYVLRTPTLDTEQMYLLMDEAQEAFGIELDPLPPPRLDCRRGADCQSASTDGPLATCPTSCALIDVDSPAADVLLPAAEGRTQAFTLWLRSADFDARRHAAEQVIRRVLAENPHTTLQVVLEPAGDLCRVTPAALETLLAACYERPSYLDWHYSLHPGRLLGSKRLVVLAPLAERDRAGEAWIAETTECASVVWWGGSVDEALLSEREYSVAERP